MASILRTTAPSILVPKIRILSRRDYRTQPGVNPGYGKKGAPALLVRHSSGNKGRRRKSGGREGFSAADAERVPNDFPPPLPASQPAFAGSIRTGRNTPTLRHPTPLFEHEDDYDWFQALRALGWLQMKRGPARVHGWCQGGELNSRPRAYESPALPLSYPGKIAIAKEAKSKTVRSGFKSLCCGRDEFRLADGRDRCLSDIAFLWMAFSSRAFGDVGSPSGSRRISNGAERDPDKPVRRCHGADPVATRALPERPDNRPLTKMPTHF